MTEKFTIFCEYQAPPKSQQSDGSFYPSQTQLAGSNQNQVQPNQAPCSTIQQIQQQQQQQQQHHLQQQHPSKREPLGLRQAGEQQKLKIALALSENQSAQSSQASQASTTSQQQQQQQPLQQQQHQPTSQTASAGPNVTKRQNTISAEEDQENDISMVSLGSEYVPSLTQGEMQICNDQSFEFDDGGSSFITTNSDNYYESGQLDSELTDDLLIEDTDMIDDEEDAMKQFEYNEALRQELSQAFKRHDDSQLFKSAVYINEIEEYTKDLERLPESRALPNYLDFQDEIDTEKRAILINWLVEVADEFELQTETLFICVNIIDRFLSEMSIQTSKLQLLGVAAMFTASKYEEIYPPNLSQFVDVTDDCYTKQQIVAMEQLVLKTLKFRISIPTITFFLNQIFAYNKFPKKVFDLAQYLCYLTLAVDQPFLEYLPSEIALASVILAAHEQGVVDKISPDLKEAYNQSNLDQLSRRQLPKGLKARDADRRKFTTNMTLPFCIESLRTMQERAFNQTSKLPQDSILVDRFKHDDKSRVALLEPPRAEDLFAEM